MNKNFLRILLAACSALGAFSFSARVAAAADFKPTHITVTVIGHGPDVILIPGLACSRDVFSAEETALSPHYRLHLVQIDGFAGSPAGANNSGPIVGPVESDLAQYIEANHLAKPAIIGHSMGGLIGLSLAEDHPGDVGKLLIVDSLPFFSVLFDPNATAQSAQASATAVENQLTAATDAQYSQMETMSLPQMVESPAGLKQTIKWALASDRGVVARAMYDVITTDDRTRESAIRCPLTLLYPWDPSTQPQAQVDAIYKTAYAPIPQARLVRVENSRHFIMFDQPDEFAAEVLGFLKS